MIFGTLGNALQPFDRFVEAADAMAARTGEEVFLQIGHARVEPRHCAFERFVGGDRYNALIREANAVLGHAGLGTVMAALQAQRPLAVMPRDPKRGEHINDHQFAMAEEVARHYGVRVFHSARELMDLVPSLLSAPPPGAEKGVRPIPPAILAVRRIVTDLARRRG